MNPGTRNQIHLERVHQVLVGLPLSIVRNAADMKVFHFGEIQPHPSGRGTVGPYALHIQCPWRLVAKDKVLTGTSDRFVGPSEGTEVNDDDPRSGNLQLVRIASRLKGFDETTKSFVNTTAQLVVMAANADNFGGADLLLSGDCRLQIFPDGSLEEDWRFVELQGRHIAIKGGRVRIDE
ncbi:Hypothetical protein NGAL_HAMBI1145_24480 [Neorhizobium galegae bv. officinalis]|uniref:Uncharacterized protein n=1 Tax=Neorhizobium galegae bv. officinalis TaxID=323656 RepID=A0A0T7FI69_NEOGA|nr:hypothetical protein [Neorhizobium galegae]CDZ34664.1 Hypothetical protein NGAL_HAMBI1145_24480 [Neorhizobium galegae bv. officinalis]